MFLSYELYTKSRWHSMTQTEAIEILGGYFYGGRYEGAKNLIKRASDNLGKEYKLGLTSRFRVVNRTSKEFHKLHVKIEL